MKDKIQTQDEAILEYLESGKSITAIEALNNFGCFRLAARINSLRNAGFKIITTTISKNGKSFAQYNLTKEIFRS